MAHTLNWFEIPVADIEHLGPRHAEIGPVDGDYVLAAAVLRHGLRQRGAGRGDDARRPPARGDSLCDHLFSGAWPSDLRVTGRRFVFAFVVFAFVFAMSSSGLLGAVRESQVRTAPVTPR